MAKITAGILNETTGKVGPVICSTWKGINYIKSYVIPFDRKSPLQKVQRDGFTFLMNICKLNYINVIKPRLALVCEGEQYSPWNEYFRLNKQYGVTPDSLQDLKFSDGNVGELEDFDVFRNVQTGTLYASWAHNYNAFKKATDSVFLYKMHREEQILTSLSNNILLRSSSTVNCGIVDQSFLTDYVCFAVCWRNQTGYSLTVGKVPHHYSP